MRLEQFVNFVEVVRERSISSASRKLQVPQQSLSSSIAALEEELGAELLERSSSGVRPNAAGLAVYEFMEQFLQEYQVLSESFHPARQKTVDHIPLAVQNNMLQTVIPRLTSELIKQQAQISLDVQEKPQEEILAMVEREEIALGIILCFLKDDEFYPELPEGVLFRQLFASRPYFWVSRQHPLARAKSISMEMVRHYPIVQNTSADEKMFHFIFAHRFGDFQVGVRTANIHLIQQLVLENMAVCPDLKMERGQLAFAHLFHDQPVVSLPLSAKDNYKMLTGYVLKKGKTEEPGLDQLLSFFSRYHHREARP